MEDVKSQFAEKILDLNDLELAALTCLVASEHCIVYAPSESLDVVADEIQEVWIVDFASSYITNST
jgi:hypothetical protein